MGWMATVLIWQMEGEGECLAWSWGAVAFTSVIASVACAFNWYYDFAPESEDDGSSWFGFGGGATGEAEPLRDGRRDSAMSSYTTDQPENSQQPSTFWSMFGGGDGKKDTKRGSRVSQQDSTLTDTKTGDEEWSEVSDSDSETGKKKKK